MARSLARDAEDFARLLLQTVERLGHDGAWVRAGQALEQTLAEHPDHVYVAQLQAKPTRRIGLSAVTERVRAAEFAHLERRKAGARRNAPVRRAALTEAPPKSPWRRRLLLRPSKAGAAIEAGPWSLRLLWVGLSGVVARIAARITRR